MPRPPRDETPGSIHHVTVRGDHGRDLFLSPEDRLSFVTWLADSVTTYDWSLLDYCLMTNHVHLLLELGERGLAAGMHKLLTAHAHRFNAVHERRGHLFGDRYFDRPVLTDEHLFTTFRYIAHNPCKAGLAASPADWRWSAYRALAGLSRPLGGLNRAATHSYVDGAQGYIELTSTPPPTLGEMLTPPTRQAMRAAIESGYTQTEIADELGISQPTVHRRLRE